MTQRLPVLFLSHGSPMNAVAENDYTRALMRLGERLPVPSAILCISAHWMTDGSWVTGMAEPETIHDFYGFPEELYQVQYPAPGSPKTAELIRSLIQDPQGRKIRIDRERWGLDHGTWSVLKHVYPKADVPVLQLSISADEPSEYHYQLGQKLRTLRDRGVLIIGSGNITHNLGRISWQVDAKPFEWAVEFDEWVKERLIKRDDESLVRDFLSTQAGKMSVPTAEHYYPLLYVLGAADPLEAMRFEYEAIQHASISMRCLSLGGYPRNH